MMTTVIATPTPIAPRSSFVWGYRISAWRGRRRARSSNPRRDRHPPAQSSPVASTGFVATTRCVAARPGVGCCPGGKPSRTPQPAAVVARVRASRRGRLRRSLRFARSVAGQQSKRVDHQRRRRGSAPRVMTSPLCKNVGPAIGCLLTKVCAPLTAFCRIHCPSSTNMMQCRRETVTAGT